MAERIVRIRRAGGFRDYSVSDHGLRTLLDALEMIRSSKDRSLLYRHSCHHGSCGTCGALVNGTPRLVCLTTLRELPGDPVVLEPLPHVLHIGDLAVHPGSLFRDIPVDAPHKRSEGVSGSYERLEDCIECGLCVAACPVEEPFIGPAALAAIHR